METITKNYLDVLKRRRDYLLERITDKCTQNIPYGYEASETTALEKVIDLAEGFMNKKTEKCETLPEESLTGIAYIEDFTPTKEKHPGVTVLKELIRNPKSKLVIGREYRIDRQYISFQNFNISKRDNYWKAGQKVSIRLTEIEEIISVLKQQEK